MKGEPLKLRIVVQAPPAGVVFSLQDADNTPVDPREADGGDLVFDLEVRCDLSGARPNFLGPFARGTPSDRFVYVAAGAQAGQSEICWDRRAKVRLDSIGAERARMAVQQDGVLSVRIPGRMKDGGPVCASVKPVKDWSIVD